MFLVEGWPTYFSFSLPWGLAGNRLPDTVVVTQKVTFLLEKGSEHEP